VTFSRSLAPIRRVFLMMIGAVILLSTTPAFAGAPTDWLKAKQQELFKLLEKEAENKKKIAGIIEESLDVDHIAEASMGDQWGKLTDAQKKEFKGLVKQLVTAAYEKNLKKVLPYEIAYPGEDSKGDSKWLVKMRAKHKTDSRADEIKIDFLVRQKDGKFKIIDIVPEDVSTVDSYRSQFVKIFKDKGYDELVKKMKEKIAKGQ
jgi:phospholipid transport system substrate-binding protein